MTREEMYNQFLQDCEDIAEQCREEGYPDHGSNYELRVDQLKLDYPELFGGE